MKRTIEDGLSLLAGLGVGTALMYLMDPDKGAERRQMIADSARTGLDTTRESFADLSESLARRARGAASDLSSGLSHQSEHARELASDYGDRLRRRAYSMMPRQLRHEEHHTSAAAVAGYAGGGLALFVLGAGLAYLFDPERGRSRRAYIGQQVSGRKHDVSQYMRKTGKHLANKARGYAAETRSAANKAAEKVGISSGSNDMPGSTTQPATSAPGNTL